MALAVVWLLFFSLSTAHLVSAAKCHVDDEAGLLAFKARITADPSGMLSSWKPGTDCCSWSSINCRLESRVTEINLYGQSDDPKSFLSGTISPSLSKLGYLTGLYLIRLRKLTGGLPAAIFQSPSLEYVYIEDAQLSGKLPGDIGRFVNLGALSLAGNRFSGPIPGSIIQLTQLTQLVLSRNFFSGKIPAGLRQLKNLTVLALAQNSLSGPIPDLSSLTDLRSLRLSGNLLTGEIPTTLSTLAPQLMYLQLGNNKLTGWIPDFLGRFTKLDTLDLSGNYLTGPVPPSFKNLTKIFNLDLSRNLLVDPFPEMKVKGIESLDLSRNKFHLGTIPKWVVSSPIIYSLNLSGCGIKMRLEDFNPSQTYFYDYIDLSDNEISGSPVGLLNRTELLLGFRASGNKLRFNMSKLALPKSLEHLDVPRNLAFGNIPASFSRLKELNVSYNRLCGELPKTKFPASAFVGNACLCGAPLPPCQRN